MQDQTRRARPVVRVLVVAEQSLVGDAVGAALASRGLETGRLPWAEPPQLAPVGREAGAVVGLLLSDLRPGERLSTGLLVVRRVPVPWVVATGAARGPLWGAMLEGGAAVVLSSATSVDAMVEVLVDAAEGRRRAEPDDEELRHAWQAAGARLVQVEAALRLLTPRERAVLRLLHAGETVRSIAVAHAVSEATVRSHVRAVLRKLEVRSQLAAVAAYAEHAAAQEVAYENGDDGEPLAMASGPCS